MTQEVAQTELRKQTQQLLDGPLKHIRVAALAAALLPLASVAVLPASAQTGAGCTNSAGICGVVWNDINNDGIQELGEPGIEGTQVIATDGTDTFTAETDVNGVYTFNLFGGPYTLEVQIPVGMQASPYNVGGNLGVSNNLGYSVVTVAQATGLCCTDFGLVTTLVQQQPGTGTPGYWKNHPEAWPVSGIPIGGITYTKAQAISWLGKVGKDKTTTMFASLVSAKLNLIMGNDGSCVTGTIAAADAWMKTYGPVGSNVAASSYAWRIGEPLNTQMDNYNNGLLCAPHRN